MKEASMDALNNTVGKQGRTTKEKWWMLAVLAYVVANSILVSFGEFWSALIPIVIGIGVVSLYKPEWVLFILAFAMPMSVQLDFDDYGLSLSVPTEPLIFPLTILFWLKTMLDGGIKKEVLRHPITVILAVQTLWVLITAITSSDHFVSIKYLIARLWFITVFYLMAVQLFEKRSNIVGFIWAYMLGLIPTIINAWINHSRMGFSQAYSSKALAPFFSDHCIYAVVIAALYPLVLIFWWRGKQFNYGMITKGFILFFVVVLTIALVLSYTRGAYISLVAALGFAIWMRYRISFRTLLIVCGLVALVGVAAFSTVVEKLSENKKVSQTDDVSNHLSSITNITTDESNTERINRWNSAIRMFEERPLLGWGPGTYSFKYGAFQLSSEMTGISTRGGTAGNAHSEYIGPLSEQGVLGPILVLLIIFIVLRSGMRLVYTSPEAWVRLLASGATLGFLTYYVHGVINNYLEIDKAISLLLVLMATITSLELYHNPKIEEQESPEERSIAGALKI